jgi:hypothetical protein
VDDRTSPSLANSLFSRRTALKGAAGVAAGLGTLELVGGLAHTTPRASAAITPNLPDIQHDIGRFIAAPTTVNGIAVQFPPVFTQFVTFKLNRTPNRSDQTVLTNALNTLENTFPFSPSGLIVFLSYGLPYFRRLPSGLVSSAIPKLSKDTTRSVLEEAIASPTDVRSSAPNITKVRFNVPVVIEANDLLLTVRSDSSANITNALNWLNGSNTLNGKAVASPKFAGLYTQTSSRTMFVQRGMPRSVANQNNLPFKNFVHPDSPMWLGFADQQTNAAGPAAITTFLGNSSDPGRTTAKAGDYFDNGSIQHLSHDILDMLQWFDMDTATSAPDDDGVFTERVQYMFHSPEINPGNADQFTDGGGPAFLPNQNNGVNYARQTAQGIGTDPDAANPGQNEKRMGHLSTLQRSSRAPDGTPIHIRMDGPGFDTMDVPDGSKQPKLQFTGFFPTGDFFNMMRKNQASPDLVQQFSIEDTENGLERFITATRRQNFLSPPRRHRSLPLVELT